MSLAVQVENLSKEYRIGQKQANYQTLRDNLSDMLAAPFRRAARLMRGERYGASEASETIWALKDISFEVQQGEAFGIIGANGAGKSTLLKVLSRITEPTVGEVNLWGRVGSLLEVGTGFHDELTGRENIYLNGAILGMQRHEINRKFDEIVDFAGVETFIDTPVKHYSSGMRLRLGFAVAAHLEPEILIVDEVLAVGDAEFQKKCIGKMSNIAGEGRTILFVSHDMSAISKLCSRAIWLDKGMVQYEGETNFAIQEYLQAGQANLSTERSLIGHPGHRNELTLMSQVRLLESLSPTKSIYKTYAPFSFEVEADLDPATIQNASLGFNIKNVMGYMVFAAHLDQTQECKITRRGTITFRLKMEQLPLLPGQYSLSLFLKSASYDLDVVDDAINFEVTWNDNLPLTYPPKPDWGVFYAPLQWDVEQAG